MEPILLPPEAAVGLIGAGSKVFVHGSAATPHGLLRALAAHASVLHDVELYNITTLGATPITDPAYRHAFIFNTLFVSGVTRGPVAEGRGDYIPVFLSEIGGLFRRGIIPLDAALVSVSPPDRHGYCSLGPSVDVALAAVKAAKVVIAQINPNMPRVHGDGMIHVRDFTAMTRCDDPLPEVDYGADVSETDLKIGAYIAGLIEDGSTLQMGIGTIPDAVLRCLGHHKHLGIHTEMFSDGLLPLIEAGVVDNSSKKKHAGKTVASFAVGTRKLYDALDDAPDFRFLEASYVNDTAVIRQNPDVVAINSAIEIDLTGQVCADSIGTYQFSGVGGQMDFIRGAALSPGGKPIIAMASTTPKGLSKIVPMLKPGAGVVTTRAHVRFVVTEFGVADLYGKGLKERARLLRDLAHPDHRETLDRAIRERWG